MKYHLYFSNFYEKVQVSNLETFLQQPLHKDAVKSQLPDLKLSLSHYILTKEFARCVLNDTQSTAVPRHHF